jgi:hypothetical protein
MLIFGERHLRSVLAGYARHYNGRRPHRSRALRPPRPDHPIADLSRHRIRRQPVLGGLIHEYRGSNFTAAFDAVLADSGIRIVLCNVRTPRMHAIAERWIGGCRRELLDRTLVWNQDHLRRILREHEIHHNQHRPHCSLDALRR